VTTVLVLTLTMTAEGPTAKRFGAAGVPVNRMDIYPLDPAKLPTQGMIAIIGRTESGKSTIARSILYHLRKKFDYILVMCGSKKDAKKWEEHVPPLYVYTDFRADVLAQILGICEKAVDTGKPKNAIIIVDDALYKSSTKRSEIMEDLACKGRQANILTVAMLHDVKDAALKNRGQLKMVLLCFEANQGNRRRAFETFNPCFEFEEEFDHAFKACTRDYGALGLWLTNRHSYDVSEYAFSYRAPFPERRFLFNKRSKQWRANRQYYDPRYRDRKYAPKRPGEEDATGKGKKGAKAIQPTAAQTYTIGTALKAPRYTQSGALIDGPFDVRRTARLRPPVVLKVHTQPKESKSRRLRLY